MHADAAKGGERLPDQQGEQFRCIACGAAIEKVLANLGSLTCHDHRPPRR